jgi:glyoxylate/hydroxypyruvate reductase A
MKRLLVAARANPKRWAELFRNQLPGHEVLDEVPASDEAPVAYMVVGRPPPGLISHLPGLEVVLSLNAGVEHLLADGEVPGHIPIVKLVDDGLTAGMVDWVLAETLAWHRNLLAYHAQQAERCWAPLPEKLARERRVSVLGAGALGTPVVELLVRVGFAARFWSRTPHDIRGAAGFAGRERLGAAVEDADILINLLPLTPETANLLDRFVFERLAPGALLINAARGAHVNEADLLAALESGRLSSAVLDVFREEPLPPEHPFWAHPKVTVSPHVASLTHLHTAVAAMAANIRRYERGEPLLNVVDRARGY